MMENSLELKALIRKNAHLFWYTKDSEKESLPLGVVLEFFINHGTPEAIKELFAIVGIKKAAKIFRKQIAFWEDRSNYILVFQNYFTLYFEKYAS